MTVRTKELDPDYRRNPEGFACCFCQRALKKKHRWVRVVLAGACERIVHPGDVGMDEAPFTEGRFAPLGMDCAGHIGFEWSMPSRDVEIASDGVTIWVNAENGYCLGRFGLMGVDVHKLECSSGNECLLCTHEPTTAKDFRTFQDAMARFHAVRIPDGLLPDRFR